MENQEYSKEVLKAYELAKKARENSHSPYSKFKVGAAVKMKGKDEYYFGHNIENVAFPSGVCAEVATISSAIVNSGTKEFDFLVVITDTDPAISPCGNCRQFISEFCKDDFPVYLANLEGIQKKMTISQLLPSVFSDFV